MSNADASKLDGRAVMALPVGAVWAGWFCEDTLLSFSRTAA